MDNTFDAPRRSPGRPTADTPAVTREQIIEAALDAFAADGFDAMSLRALARELGVSHTLIHHYFGSKLELWEAGIELTFGAVRDSAFELVASINGDSGPVEAAREFIRKSVIITSRYPNFLKIVLDEGGRGGDRLDFLYSNYFGPINDRWADRIEALETSPPSLNPVDGRALFFLCVFGGGAPFYARELARRFEGEDLAAQGAIERYADLVAGMVLEGMRVRRD